MVDIHADDRASAAAAWLFDRRRRAAEAMYLRIDDQATKLLTVSVKRRINTLDSTIAGI